MNPLQLIKKHGFFHLVEQVFNRVVPVWIMRYAIMNIYEVDPAKLKKIDRNENVVCRHADDDAARKSLRDVTFMALSEDRIAGHLGYSASIRDGSADSSPDGLPESLAGGVWAGRREYFEEDLGFKIDLAESQAWIYCALVQKSARGAGVYTNVFCHAIDDLAKRGHDNVLLSVTPWNAKSQRAHTQLVGGRIGRIYALRIFGCAFVFTSGDISKSNTMTTDLVSQPIALSLKPANG